MVIGIDHGYYAIKTKQVCFPTGIIRYEYEPYTMQNVLQYGDVYWIMEHQLQELEINGSRCFEEAHFIPDEAIIHVKCSEYFFRCCKEAERIFYDYAKNDVEEL